MNAPAPATSSENGTSEVQAAVLLRMSPELKALLKDRADREHRSLNGQAVALLEQALMSEPAAKAG